jgi:hypothetical protein
MFSKEKNELFAALALTQSELKGAQKDGKNPYFKSKYATLSSVWEAARDPLTKHGLCVTQVFNTKDDRLYLTTILAHKSGQYILSEAELPLGAKKDPQAIGSAISYFRRYALAAIVGISTADDDAEEAMKEERKPKLLLPVQVKEFSMLLENHSEQQGKLFNWLSVSSFEEIKQEDYSRAKKVITDFLRKEEEEKEDDEYDESIDH